MSISLNILFWGMEVTYLLHCLEEAKMGFVGFVKKNFWYGITNKRFFRLNFVSHLITITSIILYQIFGGNWVIIPLSISWVFVTNGLGHVLSAVITREYSPGLITSFFYWIIMYFIIKCGLLQGNVSFPNFIISVLIGTFITILMVGHLFLRRQLRRKTK